uniref:Uncharacterized protein n=1 Tax=Rhizophagus irregularis (strain DAOM 181602 / DAOM 197198 / MUCL 43194) TaxID=747089 RepID=U9TBN0_RHIID
MVVSTPKTSQILHIWSSHPVSWPVILTKLEFQLKYNGLQHIYHNDLKSLTLFALLQRPGNNEWFGS